VKKKNRSDLHKLLILESLGLGYLAEPLQIRPTKELRYKIVRNKDLRGAFASVSANIERSNPDFWRSWMVPFADVAKCTRIVSHCSLLEILSKGHPSQNENIIIMSLTEDVKWGKYVVPFYVAHCQHCGSVLFQSNGFFEEVVCRCGARNILHYQKRVQRHEPPPTEACGCNAHNCKLHQGVLSVFRRALAWKSLRGLVLGTCRK